MKQKTSALDLIWAPWRKSYISKAGHLKGCLFCRVKKNPSSNDPKNLLLHRSRHAFIILNRFPYTNGHLMIVPNRHFSDFSKLSEAERLDFLELLDRAILILRKSFHPEGFNLGMNLGRAGGAGIPGHLHLHVVPRWIGDTNFMPVATGSKVISDSLEGAYDHLQKTLNNLRPQKGRRG